VVNGVEFDTASATILLDGRPGAAGDLQFGQVVTVRGTLDPGGLTGSAETVTVDNNVIGPITSIDLATNRLIVLGQSVSVGDITQFGVTPLRALVIDNIVTVSGFTEADGVLRATRVDKTQDTFTPGTELKVEGTITNLNDAQQTFSLHMLQVNFAAAELLNLPGNRLRNGQVVEVKSTQNVEGGVLLADRVVGKGFGLQGAPGEAVELEGLITRVTAADAFEVNGQPVRLTPDTMFGRGTVDDIAVNARVEVEGVFDAAGMVIAQDIEFGAGVERQGVITRVTAADTFEINGQPVRLTPDTVFEGGTADDIAVGVRITVEGSFDAEGVLVATDIDFLVEIAGRISRITAADTFEINGRLARLTPDTMFEGGTAADITVGVLIEVKGRVDAAEVLVATEVEFLQ
jgi:hypothetical protein